MYRVATATYHNNTLNLDESFNFCEGKKLKIIIIDEDDRKKENFFDFVKKNKINIPKDYKFNREELYDR
ncbi:MAG: hypothetical protein A2086_08375 [Spirochaetes bacterium GWD1_27_9]|nr:MAG: hypothetical protein A2Z98_13395 [Spirochaetes bacterium GWB1_27_13]OHD20914.1 MAG: hypothetical protein A2Y34_11815 [Spirochaetes bacterium GWC1_27_15]OHD39415.1 MAG: hypothetical protein A2086_08375 [Spirochaetes bacterium GWD1_27_9]